MFDRSLIRSPARSARPVSATVPPRGSLPLRFLALSASVAAPRAQGAQPSAVFASVRSQDARRAAAPGDSPLLSSSAAASAPAHLFASADGRWTGRLRHRESTGQEARPSRGVEVVKSSPIGNQPPAPPPSAPTRRAPSDARAPLASTTGFPTGEAWSRFDPSRAGQ